MFTVYRVSPNLDAGWGVWEILVVRKTAQFYVRPGGREWREQKRKDDFRTLAEARRRNVERRQEVLAELKAINAKLARKVA